MSAAYDRITSALRGRQLRGHAAAWQCPAHDDRNASLSVTAEPDRVLLHCHAGCATEDVVAALGLTMGDLFDEPRTARAAEPDATFDYRDEQGQLLYQVVRQAGKKFLQRRRDGDGWIYGLNGTRRVLYRLPELLAADVAKYVFVPEGEKDVETLRSHGINATTNSGGVEGWRPEFAEFFAARRVAIPADNDDPGRRLAHRKARDLLAAGAFEVKIIEPPGVPEHGDISDWLGAGHTRDDLAALLKAAPLVGARYSRPIGVLLADVKPEPIDWLWPGYIALDVITVVDGNPGLGKSTMALDVGARVSSGRHMPDGSTGVQGGVVILSGEDHLAKVIRPRLGAIDADLNRILALPVVPDGDGEREPEIPADLDYIEQAIERVSAVLVIVDPLMAFLSGDINSHRDQDIRRVLRRLKTLAEKSGVAILVIRHLTKATGVDPLYRGGGSIGIIGAARGGLLVAPDPDVEGRVVMACSKSNLGLKPSSLAFHVEGAPNGAGVVKWDGASVHTPATLFAVPQDDDERSARQEAVEFLQDALADGPRPAKEVMREAEGFSSRTLDRARKALGVRAIRQGLPGRRGGGQSVWEIPGSTVYCANAPVRGNVADKTDSEYEPTRTVPGVGAVNQAEGEALADYAKAFPWGQP